MDMYFPFGQTVKRVYQTNKEEKEFFILGVYASAVHAKWIKDDKLICRALAVASEPRIFWDGNKEEAQRIIDNISIPKEVGSLVLPESKYNGPSGRVLDSHILKPLSINRDDVWLCDMLPECRLNANQIERISKSYNPLIQSNDLNEVTVPSVPTNSNGFCDENRCLEIIEEIKESKAKKLILLGDKPIQQFLNKVSDTKYKGLREWVSKFGYATPVKTTIGDFEIDVIAMAHPRQIGGLGESKISFAELHREWENKMFK